MRRLRPPALLACLVFGLALASPPSHASEAINPCAEPAFVNALMTNFNATGAARAKALRIVAVSQLTTLASNPDRLVCHGLVADSEGISTTMQITMAKTAAGRTTWALRLDQAPTLIRYQD